MGKYQVKRIDKYTNKEIKEWELALKQLKEKSIYKDKTIAKSI